MHKTLRDYIVSNKIFDISQDRLIIAVSGGVDSVVMLDLLRKLEVHGVVVHCNFNLRAAEADKDEIFVKEFAEKCNFLCYTKSFKTADYAKEKGISIQMAARDLRFQWFEELRNDIGYDYIALAQHRDDRVETFFINLIRGTGIAGLDSLWIKRNRIIRPIMCFGKHEIEAYAQQNNLKFREDASNMSDKYLRNKIRHHIIPLCKQMNPTFETRMQMNMDNFRFADEIYKNFFSQLKEKIICKQNDFYVVKVQDIINFHPLEKYIFELLRDFDFSPQVSHEIAEALQANAQSGKRFYSSNYVLVIDRGRLLIKKIEKQPVRTYQIDKDCKKIIVENFIEFEFETQNKNEGFKLTSNREIAMLDKSKLQFPLAIRKWRQGDFFHPLGMKGKKKISDYLIDNKFSLLEKNKTLVVLSGNDIVWLVGQRIDDRYKIAEKTNEVFVIYSQSLCADNL